MIRVNPWVAVRYVEDRHESRASASDPLQLRVRVCPMCGNEKWAVAFHGDRQVFHGFCCERNVRLLDQVRADLGLSSMREALRALGRYGETKLLLDMEAAQAKGVVESRLDFVRDRLGSLSFTSSAGAGEGALDMARWRSDLGSPEGERFLAYARARRVPDWFVASGRLGWFAPPHPLSGRLSFLVVRGGVPVYAVGRGVTPEAFPKYLTLSEAFAGRGASDVVFNLDLIKPGEIVLVCEGVLSALSAPNGIATLGKSLSDSQAWQIAQADPGAVVLLREEGVPALHVEDNAAKLRAHGVLVFHAPLLRGDPNDDPDQIPEVLELAEATGLRSRLRAKLFAE